MPASHIQEDLEQNKRFLTSLPTAYEIVYPVQLRKNEEQGLSTRDFYGRHKVRRALVSSVRLRFPEHRPCLEDVDLLSYSRSREQVFGV